MPANQWILIALLCGQSVCWSQTSQSPAPTPVSDRPLIEAFATQDLIRSPQLSPDGTRFAGMLSLRGVEYFAIFPVLKDGGESIRVPAGEKNDFVEWHWVNDDWLIVVVATTLPVQGEDWRVRRAFGVSARAPKLVPIARDKAGQDGGDILWIARDGQPRVLLAIQQSIYPNQPEFYPQVFEVDVSTGKMSSRVRPQPGVMSWFADADGVVRMGIGYRDASRNYRLLYRDKDKDTFRIIDRADSRKDESLLVPALFLAEPGKALAYSAHEGHDWLYELDLNTLTPGRKIFGVSGYDIDGLRLDSTGRVLAGVSLTEERARVEWFDPQLKALQDDLDKSVSTGGRRATIVSSSRDQKRMLVHVGSASTPGSYYFFDVDRGVMTLIGHVNEELKASMQNPVSTFRYKARDGLEMAAVLTLPKTREATKSLPLIVLPHGGPAARDAEQWDWWAQYLAHLGYAVVQPNYRGSTGYGAQFQESGAGQWGLAMQDDLLDAIDHLSREGIADPQRVCIAGASYGGYAALRAAQRDGSRFRCAISYAGVSDIAAIMRYDHRFLNPGRYRDHWRESAPDFKSVSPLQHADEFSIPVLMLHGKRDLSVPVAQSRSMAERLRKAGKAVEYIEQPQGDHHLRRTEDRLEFLQAMTRFLQAHNPAN